MKYVKTFIFKNKKYFSEKNKSVFVKIQQLNKAVRYIEKNITVMIDDFAISKNSMLCND